MIALIKRFNVNKNYVSAADNFLAECAKKYSNPSRSQEKEKKAYRDLFCKRDTKTKTQPPT
jgi:hypothetical protein